MIDLSWFDASRIQNLETPRNLIWERAIGQIQEKDNLLLGNGFIRTTFQTSVEKVSTAHNTYLKLLYTFGVIGLIIGSILILKLISILTSENIFFAIDIMISTVINDFSLFPIDFSRLFEYSFVALFFGYYLSKIENSYS
jgi:O-antigen ligase